MKKRLKKKGKLNKACLKDKSDFELAVSRRSRHYGLSLEQAKRPEAASYIGRLFLQAKLNEEHYRAAQNFLQLRHNYLKSIGTYGIYYNNEPSLELEHFEDHAHKVKTQYEACLNFIVNQCGRSALNIIEYVLVRDIETPHFMRIIREICRALDKFFCEVLTNKKNILN